jgi:hypothetical protein
MYLNIYMDNDNILRAKSLTNALTGDLDGAATITATLKTAAGVGVAGQTWPVAFEHIIESPEGGNYYAILDDEIVLDEDETYQAIIDITDGDGGVAHFEIEVRPLVRGGCR